MNFRVSPVTFVVDTLPLGQLFTYHSFLLSVSLHQCSVLIFILMPLLSRTISGLAWKSSFEGRGAHEFMNFVWKAFMPLVAHLGREGKVDRNKKKCGRSQLAVDCKKIATCILHAGAAKWNFGRIIYDL